MLIGIPKEAKSQEYRVAATPELVHALHQANHRIRVQADAGSRVGYLDDAYREAGAQIVGSAQEVFAAELILKVKEPQLTECALLREGQILFCFLHLAAAPELTLALLERKVIAIAFETVTDSNGRLPLLLPMSQIAGRVATQAGATALQMEGGGKGVLLGELGQVSPASVVVLGGGAAGTEAARVALGMGADVTVLDINKKRLKQLQNELGPRLDTQYSNPNTIREAVVQADLVIGAALKPGKRAPKLIPEALVQEMEAGSAIVDVAIDQGGCCETSTPTTLAEPTYLAHGVVHYCVTNLPSACARTATQALTHAIRSHVLALANKGHEQAFADDPHLRNGLNLIGGDVVLSELVE